MFVVLLTSHFFKVLLAEISVVFGVFGVSVVWFSLVEDTEVSALVQKSHGNALPANLVFVELSALQQAVGSAGGSAH